MGSRDRLTQADREMLLCLARRALEEYVQAGTIPQVDLQALPRWLQAPGACFVTLTKHGALRGCIGTLEAKLPLAQDVCTRAADAASRDYRFQPVTPDELDDICIEISILTNPQRLQYTKPRDIPLLLHPGGDGLILISGICRATFLPQVWDRVPQPEEFLEMLCRKAGLPPDAWLGGGVELLTYQVEHFSEESEPPPDD